MEHEILTYQKLKELSFFTKEEISYIESNFNLERIATTTFYLQLAANSAKSRKSISTNTPKENSSKSSSAENPLRRQFVPSVQELKILDYEKTDPLCDKKFSISDRIIHRYRDRVLFIATGQCALYCRHCFRRYLDKTQVKAPTKAEIKTLTDYLKANKNIREVLISGGDPLVLDNSLLEYLCKSIREVSKNIVIRIGTRVPVVLPSRIDSALVNNLQKYRPLYIFTQFNHSDEVAEQNSEAIDLLVKSGIPVFNQTVLLRGINNLKDQLKELFYKLVSISVKPYYFFQGDIAAGTSHFRTNLMQGIEIMEELKTEMSSLSLPLLAVDLPDGGGKIMLDRNSIVKRENGFYYLKNSEGKVFKYPDENQE
ncbi:MAG: KamA family radical SAM protein [Spirochaetes bacterium]|nr:KamA family radical SAM protein [Spirochaetota bacterium]